MFESMKVFFGFQDETEGTVSAPNVTSAATKDNGQGKPPVIKSFKGAIVKGAGGFPSSEIKIEEPSIYEDSLTIATYLRDNKPVIVNVRNLDSNTGKRLIDFVCGTAYAINGHMMKIGDTIFLFTPENVLISDSEDRHSLGNELGQGDLSQTGLSGGASMYSNYGGAGMGHNLNDDDQNTFLQNALG